jgi:acyl dehydratase
MGVNYGTNKVRFTGSVPVGSRLRIGATLAQTAEAINGGVQVTVHAFECEGSTKPSCVADLIFRYYF